MLYEVALLENKKIGECPVWDYLKELEKKQARYKTSQHELFQFMLCVEFLEKNGIRNDPNIMAKVEDDLWELRPQKNRVLYFYDDGIRFVLLHCSKKKRQKAMICEIEKAKNEIKDYLRAGGC